MELAGLIREESRATSAEAGRTDVVHVRIWSYEVDPSQADRFVATYGSEGTWSQLFARAPGYLGTELYRDVTRPYRFVTVDRWADAAAWADFLMHEREVYDRLDRELRGIAHGGNLLIAGG